MKKLFYFIAIIGMLLAFTSCKAKKDLLGKYDLGYGDYVQTSTQDTSMEEEYKALSAEQVGIRKGIFQSKYQKGALDFFNLDYKIKLEVEITQETLQKLNQDYEVGNKESYHKCNLNIYYNTLQFHYEDVGIRQKGNSSRGSILTEDGKINLRHYKLSFSETFDDEFRDEKDVWQDKEALDYRENRTFFGLDKLILRWNRNADGTYLKEFYANEIYRNNDVLAPHCNLIQLEMNIKNQKENLGVYLAIEDINKDFIKRNLVKESAKGDLYKLGWTNVGAKLNSLDDSLFGVEYQIKDGDHYKEISFPYDLKSNKKTSKHEALKAFIQEIMDTTTSDFDDFLKKNTIYDSVISYLAISYLLGDPDDLRGNFNNTYLYFTKDTSLAFFIPTDSDRALGSTGGTGNPTKHHGALNGPFDLQTGYMPNDMPFFEKSILSGGNEQIRKDYVRRIQEILDTKWFSFDTFLKYYTKALQYEEDVKLGKNVLTKPIVFSLKEATSLEDEWNLSIEVYLTKKRESFLSKDWTSQIEEINYSSYYLRGDMNDWNGIESSYQLRMIAGIPTIEIFLEANQSFKIASRDWKTEWNYTNLIDNKLFLSASDNHNIGVKESGYYTIQILDEGLSIIKK